MTEPQRGTVKMTEPQRGYLWGNHPCVMISKSHMARWRPSWGPDVNLWVFSKPSSREHLVKVRQHVGDCMPQRHAATRVPNQVGRCEFMHHRGTEPARDAAQRGGRGGLKCVCCDEYYQEQHDGNRAHHPNISLAALK